jgi:hypothetical protein
MAKTKVIQLRDASGTLYTTITEKTNKETIKKFDTLSKLSSKELQTLFECNDEAEYYVQLI